MCLIYKKTAWDDWHDCDIVELPSNIFKNHFGQMPILDGGFNHMYFPSHLG